MEFGKFIRRRYTKLIGIFGSRRKVQFESSGGNRTKDSASTNSKAMFPISSLLKSKTIHIVPKSQDYLLQPSFKCQRFVDLYGLFLFSPEIQSKLQMITPFRQYVEFYSGSKLRQATDFYKFYDSLNIESLRGLR